MSNEISCPKCSGGMIRGSIPELSQGSHISFWVEGEPEHSFWAGGVKIPEDKID